jgi:hypothetical protein
MHHDFTLPTPDPANDPDPSPDCIVLVRDLDAIRERERADGDGWTITSHGPVVSVEIPEDVLFRLSKATRTKANP